MKKPDKRWTVRLGAIALTAALLGTSAALASGGDKADPLVTLSYLNQTAIPQIVKQVEEKTTVRQKELQQSFTDQINQYKKQEGQGPSASFTLVTLRQGQTLSLSVGCELLLRIGTAAVQADGSPALIDLSAGNTIDSGVSLTRNHLYMSTIDGRTVTATAGTVKLLVRGGYTVA